MHTYLGEFLKSDQGNLILLGIKTHSKTIVKKDQQCKTGPGISKEMIKTEQYRKRSNCRFLLDKRSFNKRHWTNWLITWKKVKLFPTPWSLPCFYTNINSRSKIFTQIQSKMILNLTI